MWREKKENDQQRGRMHVLGVCVRREEEKMKILKKMNKIMKIMKIKGVAVGSMLMREFLLDALVMIPMKKKVKMSQKMKKMKSSVSVLVCGVCVCVAAEMALCRTRLRCAFRAHFRFVFCFLRCFLCFCAGNLVCLHRDERINCSDCVNDSRCVRLCC